jgi:hypothetical protein
MVTAPLPPTVGSGGYRAFARAADAALRPLRRTGAFQLTPRALIEAAARRTRLEEAAPGELTEPLELLCEDLARHEPTDLGAVMVWTSLVQALVNRRRIQQTPVEARSPVGAVGGPVIVVGWHRTGTTLLQQLLDAVPGLGFVPLHQLMEPVWRAGSLLRAAAATRLAWAIAPEMPTLHPQAVRGPEECWILLMSSLRVDGFALHWHVPGYAQWLEASDPAPAYRLYARALALLEARRGHRLVMKDAAHLLALPELLRQVPDARLVWTHRDPVACVGSFASLSAVHHRSMYGRYEPERAGRVCLQRMATSLGRAVAARPHLADGQLVDVAYDDLLADPVGAVARVCATFGIPLTEQGRTSVAQRAIRLGAMRPPVHRWTLAQWGLHEAEVRAEVADYPAHLWAR